MSVPVESLSKAAVALYAALSSANVQHGIFGGYAVAALGGPRASKDADCVAASNRARLVAIIGARSDFTLIPQTREDYVSFWHETPTSRPVLVELFPTQFLGQL